MTDLSAYTDVVYADYLRCAESATDPAQFSVRIADRFTVLVKVAHHNLVERFTNGMRHLLCEETANPDLTICLWENPLPSFAPYARWGTRLSPFIGDAHIRMFSGGDDRRLMLVDLQRNLGLFWMSSFDRLMWFEDARPLIDILHWWLRTKNHYMVHGGAVGTEYGGALLAGHGGAGKSTTALTCLISGMKYAADDFCLIGKAEGVASVFGIYTSAKLHPHGLEQLPALNDCVSERPCLNDGDDSKKILFLHPEFQNQIAARMPLRLILLPRIGTNRETTFAPATHHNVIKALIPSSTEILKGSELNDFYGVFALTRRLPAFFLDLGSDKTHIASTIASLIRAVTDGLDPFATVSSAIDQFESPLAPKYKQPACPN